MSYTAQKMKFSIKDFFKDFYPKFEEDVLEYWLAVVTHKKMLKLRHGLLVVLQDLQETNWKFYS